MIEPDDIGGYVPPLFVRRHEVIGVARAMEITGLSEKHIRRIFKKHKLGAQSERNSDLSISEPGLLMVFHGDYVALELLRDGKRNHPIVKRYFEQAGYVFTAPRRTKALEPTPRPEWRRLKDLTPTELKHALAMNPDLHHILDLNRDEYAEVTSVPALPLEMAGTE